MQTSILTKENKKHLLFKSIINNENYNYIENITNLPIISLAKLIKLMKEKNNLVKQNDYGISELFYPHLLLQMKNLADELKLSRTLELSNMFTYLLWNGYLSKNKTNIYKIENRKEIDAFLFADIVDGASVCINHADMLKDFLIFCNHNAAMLLNLITIRIDPFYEPDIDRNFAKILLSTRLRGITLTPIQRLLGNHAFTLIEENEKLYIYDATNLIFCAIDDINTAYVIHGFGDFNLKPYYSYLYANTDKEVATLDKLLTSKNFYTPYHDEEFINITEQNIQLLNNNLSLLNDFHDEIKNDLINISNATTKIKKRTMK